MSIVREQRGGVVHLLLEGELDLATAPLLARAVAREQREDRPLVADLSGLRFMDSCGLRELLRASSEDPGFRIAGAAGAVRRVIDVCGVEAHLAFAG